MSCFYAAVDGDNIGSYLEFLVTSNNVRAISEFSKRYESAMGWLEQEFTSGLGASIIFRGGDNLLACFPDDCRLAELENIRLNFSQRASKTLSIGIGWSPRQALYALQYAKASGKDCVRRFDELPDEQLNSDCNSE